MKIRFIRLLGVILLILAQLTSLAGCGGEEAPSATEPVATQAPTKQEESTEKPAEEVRIDMELRYDDRFSFETAIAEIETLEVTSRQVENGEADVAVLRLASKNDDRKVIACGIGTAKVTLADGSVKTVKVTAADISMLLIIGQSNAEGQIQPLTGNFDKMTYIEELNRSILCEEGQIYSTYAPGLSTTHGGGIGNVAFESTLSNKNGKQFVASSLTSTKALDGDQLLYPLHSLSASGKGKTGTDSGIAYEWNQATGHKVWVINAAHGGSSIDSWQPGTAETNNDFWQAVNLFKFCEEVMQKEIKAGHYRLQDMGYFWLQGEANMGLSAEDYAKKYETMHKALKEMLLFDSNSDGTADATLKFGGLMMVRSCIAHTGMGDLILRGPRIAQYYMGQTNNEAWSDVYLATTAMEKWISDRSVKSYFSEKYGKSYPYSMRKYTALAEDMTDVHPNIHYRQLGYNEIGITAARTVADILAGKKTEASAASIRLLKTDGMTQFREADPIVLEAGEMLITLPKSMNGLPCEGGIELTTDLEGLQISYYSITAPHLTEAVSGKLYVKLNGETVLTFTVTVNAVKVDLPDLPSDEDYGEVVFPELPQ